MISLGYVEINFEKKALSFQFLRFQRPKTNLELRALKPSVKKTYLQSLVLILRFSVLYHRRSEFYHLIAFAHELQAFFMVFEAKLSIVSDVSEKKSDDIFK